MNELEKIQAKFTPQQLKTFEVYKTTVDELEKELAQATDLRKQKENKIAKELGIELVDGGLTPQKIKEHPQVKPVATKAKQLFANLRNLNTLINKNKDYKKYKQLVRKARITGKIDWKFKV